MPNERQRPITANRRIQQAWGIRGRLTVLALIAMVPLLLDRVRDIEADRADRIAAASTQVRQSAQDIADEQNELLVTSRSVLQVVAQSYGTFGGSTDRCETFLANLAAGLPWARAVSVAGPGGRIDCSSNPSVVGLDISDRSQFREPARTGGFFVSEYMQGRRSAGPSMFAAFPRRAADGSVEAVAVIALDLSWLNRRASVVAERTGSVVLMVDGVGTVIARQPDPDSWIGRQFGDHPLIRAMLAASEGTITERGLDGIQRIFGFVRLPHTDARLAVGLDENQILHRVDVAMWRAYAQLSLIAGIVLIGIWFGGKRLFVQPIHVLAHTATRFGEGELEARASEKPWASEFVPLATALDNMAGRLSARQRELRASNDRLKALAQADGLTRLANRRTFDARLASEWQRAAKLAQPLALLMIDIDYFKRLNDRDGHLAGDACLRSLGKVLAAAVRQHSDLAARYGGEEFALLLPGADLDAATKAASRLRTTIENLRMAHLASPLGHVTISIGVAAFRPQPGVTPERLIEAADAGLYAAKRGGRNRVAVEAPLPPLAVAS